MVGSLVGMDQLQKKFTGEVFWRCRGLTAAKDFGASWEDGFDDRNKTQPLSGLPELRTRQSPNPNLP